MIADVDLSSLLLLEEGYVDHLSSRLKELTRRQLRKRGVVLGLSGGIDSSVTAALCVRALGADRVVGLLMPERESDDDSSRLGHLVADALGISTITEDITPLLEAVGCYERRDTAIRRVIPEYGPGWKSKIVLPDLLSTGSYRLYQVVARAPDGTMVRERLTPDAYLEVVAATSFKQRSRKMLEYFHADRLNYAVAGTPNRLEYDQGFFVKLGDGAADVKPIAHLYKTQVYQLADYLELPEEVRSRPPTTDTYSLPQSQEEFYFSVPYQQMDICLYAVNNGVPTAEAAAQLGLSVEQVQLLFNDIASKRQATANLHRNALLMEAVPEVGNVVAD